MATKVLLRDKNENIILPITRGELVLDSSGKVALHSTEFLATGEKPGLMSSSDKAKLDSVAGGAIDDKLDVNSSNPVLNKVLTQIINSIKEKYLKSASTTPNRLTLVDQDDSEINFYNTTYNVVTNTAAGLAPLIVTATDAIQSPLEEWVLTSKNGETPTWKKLPINAFSNDNSDTTYSINGLLSGNDYIITLKDSFDKFTKAVISPFIGSTVSSDGLSGIVPRPTILDRLNFLRGDGTWANVSQFALPYTEITSKTDVNTLLQNCIYNVKAELTNTPVTNWGTLLTMGHLYYTVLTYWPDSGSDIYIRRVGLLDSTKTTNWRRVLHTGNYKSIIQRKATLAGGTSIKSAGWYRCATIIPDKRTTEGNVIISLLRSYNSPEDEHYIFSLSPSYYSPHTCITQLSGYGPTGKLITKVRLVYGSQNGSGGPYYFDFYYNGESYSNSFVVEILAGDCSSIQTPTLTNATESYCVELSTTNGVASNYGFTGTFGNFGGPVTLTGTTADTAKIKFSGSGASTWNYIIWPGNTSDSCLLAFGYDHLSAASYYYMSNKALYPANNNTRSLGTSAMKWLEVHASTVYGKLIHNTVGTWIYSAKNPAVMVSGITAGSAGSAFTIPVKEGYLSVLSLLNSNTVYFNYFSTTKYDANTNEPSTAMRIDASSGNFSAKGSIGTDATGGGAGVSLYGGAGNTSTYGIAFNQTSSWGKHGLVTGDWATYFTMSNTDGRGWIFRRSGVGPVASIDTKGNVTATTFNGDLNGTSSSTLRFKTILVGSSTTKGKDLNTELSGGGIARNYNSYLTDFANAPTGALYGSVLEINTNNGTNQSLSLQLAWDVNHANTTDTTRYLWWRTADETNKFTYSKWHRVADFDKTLVVNKGISLTDSSGGVDVMTPDRIFAQTGEYSLTKTRFYYAGNGYTTATKPDGTTLAHLDLAGASILTFGASSAYTQLFITAPAQAGHSGITNEMLFYLNHGSGYSPGWTRVLTNRNYKSIVVGEAGSDTSDFSDGTEILTSYASDYGFSSAGYVNEIYKRKASSMFNYIKTKAAIDANAFTSYTSKYLKVYTKSDSQNYPILFAGGIGSSSGTDRSICTDSVNSLYYNPSSNVLTSYRFASTVATGTAPMTISSTTVVTNLNADMVDGKHASDFAIPVGTIMMWAGSTAPTGWLLCNGSAVSRTTYSALFAVISTTYGTGNGSTTFNVPNLVKRFPLGADTQGLIGLDSSRNGYDTTLGKSGGSATHTLTVSELPSHRHSFTALRDATRVSGLGADVNNILGIHPSGGYTGYSGSNYAHNNIPPFLAVNFIIKY